MSLSREKLVKYWWQGRPEDLPDDKEYAVIDSYLNRNNRDLAEAIGAVLMTGDQEGCTEGTDHYGASDTTHCRLTLPLDRTEIGDVLIIGDGSREWCFTIVYEDEIEITDTELIVGTADIANYNTIQNSLYIVSFGKTALSIMITKDHIARGSFALALHADDLQMSQTVTTNLKTKVDLIDVEHETDGTHSTEIIDNDNLVKDTVLATQGNTNIVRNGAFNINGVADSSYWSALASSTLTAESNVTSLTFPSYDLKMVVTDDDSGAQQTLIRGEVDIPVTFAVWLKGTVGKKGKIILQTDTASAEQAVTFAGTWERVHVHLTPDDTATLKVKISSDEAGTQTIYAALATVRFGDIVQKPERSAQDVLYDAVHTLNFYIPTLCSAATDSIYAVWTPKRNIKLIRIDAYVHLDPATDNAIIRLTDGSSDVDTTIAIGDNAGANTTTVQEFAASTPLTLKVVTNTTTDGTECNVVIQYRMV